MSSVRNWKMSSVRNWIRQLFAPRPKILRHASRSRLQLEYLEDRVVPAFVASVAGTEVTFADTAANEQLWLREYGGNLEYSTVNGATGTPGAFTSTGLSAASVTKITINSASDQNVDTLYLNDASLTTSVFTSLAGGIQVNGLSGAVAIQTGTSGTSLAVTYHYTGSNIYDVANGPVNSGSKLSVFYDGVNVGQVDHVILGTANHDAPGYALSLIGTAQDDLIFGFGGDDVIDGAAGNDIIIGGIGNDNLSGGDGDDTFVYRGGSDGYDMLNGGSGTNRILAVGAGTVIGVKHLNVVPSGPNMVLNDNIQKIDGSSSGDTIVSGSPSVHSTLNLTNVKLNNIKEIVGAGTTTDNSIYVSTLSDAVYRGDGGNDTFYLKGSKTVTLLYSGANNGFDNFVGTMAADGSATAVAETANTVIGIGNYNNQLVKFQGYEDGSTIIRASDSVHNTLNFANTDLTNINSVESGGGDDYVTTSLDNRTPSLTYDGGSYTGDKVYLAVTLEEVLDNASAIAADFALAKASSGGPVALTNYFKFTVKNFEGARLAVYNDGQLVGLIDNIIFGTNNHDTTTPGYAPALNGTTKNDLIFGLGGDDVVNGGAGDDIIIAGDASKLNDGNDYLDGGAGNDVFVYRGNTGYYDTLNGGSDFNRILAVGAGTVIGVKQLNVVPSNLGMVLNDNIQEIDGSSSGDTIVSGSPSVHSTLNLTNVELNNIKEIVGAGTTTDNSIYVSTLSDAVYRGDGGNDTFYLKGSKTVTLLYKGASNGFDNFVGTMADGGSVTAVAETANTVIGIGNYNNQLVEFKGSGDGSTIIRASDGVHNSLNFANTLLTNIAKIDAGGGDDTITFSNLSAGTYRGGSGNDRFVVVTGGDSSEENVIEDFTNGADKIDVTSTPISVTQDGADTLLVFASGRKLRLLGFTATDFDPTDMI